MIFLSHLIESYAAICEFVDPKSRKRQSYNFRRKKKKKTCTQQSMLLHACFDPCPRLSFRCTLEHPRGEVRNTKKTRPLIRRGAQIFWVFFFSSLGEQLPRSQKKNLQKKPRSTSFFWNEKTKSFVLFLFYVAMLTWRRGACSLRNNFTNKPRSTNRHKCWDSLYPFLPHVTSIATWANFVEETSHLPSLLYISDGGHTENIGLLPLLSRRLKTIVLVNGGEDPLNEDLKDAFCQNKQKKKRKNEKKLVLNSVSTLSSVPLFWCKTYYETVEVASLARLSQECVGSFWNAPPLWKIGDGRRGVK